MRFVALLLLGASSVSAHVQIPIAFEPNRGQAGSSAEFVAHAPGYSLSLHGGTAEFLSYGSRITASPLGARPSQPHGEQPLAGTSTYLKGPSSRWVRDLPT